MTEDKLVEIEKFCIREKSYDDGCKSCHCCAFLKIAERDYLPDLVAEVRRLKSFLGCPGQQIYDSGWNAAIDAAAASWRSWPVGELFEEADILALKRPEGEQP